jgi:hypothetical protein
VHASTPHASTLAPKLPPVPKQPPPPHHGIDIFVLAAAFGLMLFIAYWHLRFIRYLIQTAAGPRKGIRPLVATALLVGMMRGGRDNNSGGKQ